MAWDKNLIAEGVLAPDLNDEIRANWAALEAMLDAWMKFATGGTQTGQPRQGSARVYFQDAVPTARLDGEYFDSADLGTPWVDTNSSPDNQFNLLTAADGAGTETWTPISTEIIAVLVAAAHNWAGVQTFNADMLLSGSALEFQIRDTGEAIDDGGLYRIVANAKVILLDLNTATGGDFSTYTRLWQCDTTKMILADGSQLATSAAPVNDADIANKKYVVDQDAADHPTYSGGESHTDGSGLITKMGYQAIGATSGTITFGTAFPNGVVGLSTALKNSGSTLNTLVITDFTTADIDWAIADSLMTGFWWIAKGY